jgi:hypothetical protein
MYLPIILFFTTVAAGVPTQRGSYNLLTLDPTVDTSNFPACEDSVIISCVAATVNWDSLKNPDENTIILPTGDEMFEKAYIKKYGLEHHDTVEDSPVSLQYMNANGSEAVITYKGNSLYGDIELGRGRDYLIEQHDDEYHLWIQVDNTKFIDEESVDVPAGPPLPHMRMDELIEQGQADRARTTVYSVTVYYTKAFKRSTRNVAAFVDQVIAETNAGYINSKIPIRIKLHCLLESSIPDNMDPEETLNRFADSMGSSNNLRKSADTVVLLVKQFSDDGICGVNYFNRISDGYTVGTVMKSCALGYYSFGHEIGHGLGLTHDRRVSDSSSTNYAYGYIIKRGKYRTIMAYNDQGETRVNYYSNPDVDYRRFPTGNSRNDNARVLTDVRFATARIGNEKMSCN